jgi:hypothetical protein
MLHLTVSQHAELRLTPGFPHCTQNTPTMAWMTRRAALSCQFGQQNDGQGVVCNFGPCEPAKADACNLAIGPHSHAYALPTIAHLSGT